jgi:hypothetical protein
MNRVIYNVLIGGVSVGMTFNKSEAMSWVAQSMYQGKKEILTVAYDGNQ